MEVYLIIVLNRTKKRPILASKTKSLFIFCFNKQCINVFVAYYNFFVKKEAYYNYALDLG